jgi:aminoglycoside phosphotransferase (APT) family kinase protein
VTDHCVERNALRLLWATLRQDLVPDLGGALAKDRAKRADAALVRLIAGYEQLPDLRAAHAGRYAALLERARTVTGGAKESEPPADGSGAGDLVFVGIPATAHALETELVAIAALAERDDRVAASFETLLADVVIVEATCRGDYEQRVMRMVASAAAGGARAKDVTADVMQEYLRLHPSGSSATQVLNVTEIPGGRSKRTVLVRIDGAGRLPDELVLRLDTGRGVGTSVADEFPLLSSVAKLGLPVPEPLWLESSAEPFGFPFIVFRRMPGAAAGDLIEGAFRKEPVTARSLARALGRVHDKGRALVAPDGERVSSVKHTRELLTHYLDWWRAKKPFPSLVIESAFMWLLRRLDGGLGDASVVHADTGFHNLLLDDQGNGCLLDWEFAHLGDPAEDLASCRPAVEKCLAWDDFMAEYQAHGGEPVSDFRLTYFEIWRPLRNAVVCGTVLHSLMQGEADDIDPVTIGLSTFARLQADLARSLSAVLQRSQAA